MQSPPRDLPAQSCERPARQRGAQSDRDALSPPRHAGRAHDLAVAAHDLDRPAAHRAAPARRLGPLARDPAASAQRRAPRVRPRGKRCVREASPVHTAAPRVAPRRCRRSHPQPGPHRIRETPAWPTA
eukprot:scaffold27185_cov97-Isochrysis_galbana.AAC.5